MNDPLRIKNTDTSRAERMRYWAHKIETWFYAICFFTVFAIAAFVGITHWNSPDTTIWVNEEGSQAAWLLDANDDVYAFRFSGTRVSTQCEIRTANLATVDDKGVIHGVIPLTGPEPVIGDPGVPITIERRFTLLPGDFPVAVRSCASYDCRTPLGSNYTRQGCTPWTPVAETFRQSKKQ